MFVGGWGGSGRDGMDWTRLRIRCVIINPLLLQSIKKVSPLFSPDNIYMIKKEISISIYNLVSRKEETPLHPLGGYRGADGGERTDRNVWSLHKFIHLLGDFYLYISDIRKMRGGVGVVSPSCNILLMYDRSTWIIYCVV